MVRWKGNRLRYENRMKIKYEFGKNFISKSDLKSKESYTVSILIRSIGYVTHVVTTIFYNCDAVIRDTAERPRIHRQSVAAQRSAGLPAKQPLLCFFCVPAQFSSQICEPPVG